MLIKQLFYFILSGVPNRLKQVHETSSLTKSVMSDIPVSLVRCFLMLHDTCDVFRHCSNLSCCSSCLPLPMESCW